MVALSLIRNPYRITTYNSMILNRSFLSPLNINGRDLHHFQRLNRTFYSFFICFYIINDCHLKTELYTHLVSILSLVLLPLILLARLIQLIK